MKLSDSVASAVPDECCVTLSGVTEGNRADALVGVLAEHIRRQAPEEELVASGFLPTIPVDVPDFLLAIFKAVDSPEGYSIGPANVKWPGGKISLDPPFQLEIRKFITLSASLDGMTVSGDTVKLLLTGLPDLTVRFK